MNDPTSILADLREGNPLIHSMTNTVVPQITANVLLAVGAAPAMIDLPAEAEIFASIASGVLINVGNGSAEQHVAMRTAAAAAQRTNTPWVLDPVAVGGLPVRTQLAVDLLANQPSAIRGNASEIAALAGAGPGGRGVDAATSVESAIEPATGLAANTGSVVAISGPTDVVISDQGQTRITGGSPLMALVIGTGCSLGAVVAACIAVAPDRPHQATVAAHALFGAAGLVAARKASAPASFEIAWRDALYELTPDQVGELVEISDL